MGSLLSAGCAAVWVTPTPDPSASVQTPSAATQPPLAEPSPAAPESQETPVPSPTPLLAAITVGDEPVQFWTNPNDIQGLAYDGESLWAATSGGVVRWNTAMTDWSLYTADDGLATSSTGSIAVDRDGDVWVGYPGLDAWSEFDGAAWQTYTRSEAVTAQYSALLEARHYDCRLWVRGETTDWVWFPTHDGQVRAYDGTNWHAYGPYEGVRPETRFVVVTPQGRVWAAGDGLSTVLEGYRWWEDHTLFSDIPRAEDVTSLAVDPTGQTWIGFVGTQGSGGGICSLDVEENRWIGHLHSLNPTLPENVHNIMVDRSGTMWLCGENAITYQPIGGMWTRVPVEGQTVQCLYLTDHEQVWLGTTQGIWLLTLDDGSLQGPWTVPTPFTGGDVNHLALTEDGALFLGTPRGLIHATPGQETTLVLEDTVQGLALGDNHLWVNTAHAVYSVDGSLQPSLVVAQQVEALAVGDDGTPWILLADWTIARIVDGQLEPFTTLVPPPNVLVNDLAIGGDTLWLATTQGLVRVTPDGDSTVLTVDDGLSDLDVRALDVGPDGALWIGTANGLTRLQASVRWTRFTTESTGGGLHSQTIASLTVDDAGTLWLATSAGISMRTAQADWYYLDMYGLDAVYPESASVVWAGGKGGLHRVDTQALVPVW